jgi:glycosyltransferase involved in cell wall biosynthesis
MKVLHIIDSGGLYGAEIMLLNLVAEQVKLGLEPVIASIGEKGGGEKPIEVEAEQRGLAVRTFRMRPGPNLAGAIKVLDYARSGGFDLLHSHGYKGNILFGLIPRFFRKIPMVSTLHGYTHVSGFSRMGLYEWLDSLSLRFIDAVVLVDNTMQSHPKLKKLNGIKFRVVNNGIPFQPDSAPSNVHTLTRSRAEASSAEEVGGVEGGETSVSAKIVEFCQSGFTIGAVGRLSHEKGFEFLIKASADLVAEGRNIQLVIMGEGELRNDLEHMAAVRGLGDRLLLPGYVPNAKRFLSFLGLFTMPSLTEGLPMVLLEAMAAGVPIVASRVGGIPEVLSQGRTGILVPARDVAALKEGIRAVMDDPAAARQRAADASEHVHTNYSSRAMAEQYLDVYRQVDPAGPLRQIQVTM